MFVDSRRSIPALANRSFRIARFKEPGFLLIRNIDVPGIRVESEIKGERTDFTLARSRMETLARPVPIPGSVSMIDLGISFVRRSFRRGKRTKRSAAEPAGTGSPSRFKPIRCFLFFSPSFSPPPSLLHPRYACIASPICTVISGRLFEPSKMLNRSLYS